MIFLIPNLLTNAREKRTTVFKIISLVLGGFITLAVIPGLFFLGGRWIDSLISHTWSSWVRFSMVGVFIPLGLFFVVWSVMSQWKMVSGAPDSQPGTDVFFIVGPYSYCRNPFLLGLMFFYMGLGTLLVSVTAGMAGVVLGFLAGTLHFKLVEEKEWEKRFPDEYDRYRDRTSYIFPKSINWV